MGRASQRGSTQKNNTGITLLSVYASHRVTPPVTLVYLWFTHVRVAPIVLFTRHYWEEAENETWAPFLFCTDVLFCAHSCLVFGYNQPSLAREHCLKANAGQLPEPQIIYAQLRVLLTGKDMKTPPLYWDNSQSCWHNGRSGGILQNNCHTLQMQRWKRTKRGKEQDRERVRK